MSPRAVAILLTVLLVVSTAAEAQDTIRFGNPLDRPDRLLPIVAERDDALVAEYSVDEGATWRPATVYPGASIDERRATETVEWNRSVKTGLIPADSTPCVWNYWFDLAPPFKDVRLRLRAASDPAIVSTEEKVDLSVANDVVAINAANVAEVCGGRLPKPWTLAAAGVKEAGMKSILCKITDEVKRRPRVLVLNPRLKGWYRLYVGMEPYSTCRVWLSGVNARYEVPNYINQSSKSQQRENRFLRESMVCEADMTGQDICIAPGGARTWHDVSVRYARLVPMSKSEVAAHRELRRMARERGRPFVGYLEPVTPCNYEPESLTLAEHIRNEMKLNQMRGSTEVYVHVIRIGSKAWYHSDVETRFMGGEPNWPRWMRQGDPMAVAVEQARRHRLKVFADAGMNACYFQQQGHYEGRTGDFVLQHPEVVCPGFNKHCMDYRKPIVRDYVVSIIAELLTKYDLDGVNLDFGRWGHRAAFDVDSLLDVVRRIDAHRKEAEKKWGHPMLISTRVDFDEPPKPGEPEPTFLAAVRGWAKAGLIDRVMVNLHKRLAPDTPLGHYLDAIQGTKTRLWGDLYWGTWNRGGGPEKDLAIARGWVEQGLDGGFFYYMRARPTDFEDVNWRLRAIDRAQ